jgi:hypothetical protein
LADAVSLICASFVAGLLAAESLVAESLVGESLAAEVLDEESGEAPSSPVLAWVAGREFLPGSVPGL